MKADSAYALAIVVVNYGSHHLLETNLVQVARECPDALVVVVDSYFDVHERAQVRALTTAHRWQLVEPSANIGFGGGMNRGVERAMAAGATEFLLLNPDATIDAASIQRLREEVHRNPLALCAPTIVTGDGKPWFAGADLYLDDGSIRAARKRIASRIEYCEPWLSGACLMVSADLWKISGGFVEEFFLYWEDVDLSYRVQKLGGQVICLPDALAVHDEGGTHRDAGAAMSSTAKSPTYYYYNIRNRLLFAARNLDVDSQRAWQRHALRAAREVLLRGGRRQFVLQPYPVLSAAIRGLRDGSRFTRSSIRAGDGAFASRAADGGTDGH